MNSSLFSEIHVGTLALKNRIVRSATYEGSADTDGLPGDTFRAMYEELASNEVGLIITGFSYVARTGRAMQPGQSGLASKATVNAFRRVTDAVHRCGTPIVAQLAHTGRQTRRSATGSRPVSSTWMPSPYFRSMPRKLREKEVHDIVRQFTIAAVHAQESGFDGVQLHAAHGYLLHQFLLPNVNRLQHAFGIDQRTGLGFLVTDMIIDSIRAACGREFPILVKISGETDADSSFFPDHFDTLIASLDRSRVAAIEVSYGTMDVPMNIFRGECPLSMVFRYNPLFQTRSRLLRAVYAQYAKRVLLPAFLPFTPMYNLHYAARAKRLTDLPIITVGGARAKAEMEAAVTDGHTDLVAMSRPFLREPDFVIAMRRSADDYSSKCSNCNQCVLMCDAGRPTKCYQRTHESSEGQTS